MSPPIARRLLQRTQRGFAVLLLLSGLWLCAEILLLPDIEPLLTRNPFQTSYMRRHSSQGGQGSANLGTWTPLNGISPVLACAVVKAEDHSYFHHRGFDWAQLRRAMWQNLSGQGSMGGSTITQQLARNLFLGPDRTPRRKVLEAGLTLRMERSLSKERILELYLNVIEWGEGIWGITAAAYHYFAKPPGSLDAFESTLLAALIAAPTRPLAGQNLERVARSQRRTLAMLRASGVITHETWLESATRANSLYAALALGTPLDAALGNSRAMQPRSQELSSRGEAELPLTSALSARCEPGPSLFLPP